MIQDEEWKVFLKPLPPIAESYLELNMTMYLPLLEPICMFLWPELFLVVLCVFRCRPVAQLPLATSTHHVLLSKPIIVQLSVVTL